MPAELKELWLVVQEGGSAGERYPSLYDSKEDADAARRGHTLASYRSTEPIPVTGHVMGDELVFREGFFIAAVKFACQSEFTYADLGADDGQ